MLDCLLISPANTSDIYQSLSTDYSSIEPNLWAGLLANALRVHDKEVAILDLAAMPMSPAMLCSYLEGEEIKLIVMCVYGSQPSASTQAMDGASKLCKQIKSLNPDQKIMMIGGHVSSLPDLTMHQEEADYVAKGEGLTPILGVLSGQSLKDIPGLYYRELDQILQGPKDKAATDLVKTYPGVAWDLMPMTRYRASNWHCFGHLEDRNSYASIYTSLGCPFRCSFCCINAPFDGSSFRYWDPEFTAQQIHQLSHKYGVRNLKLADEMFVLREDHFLKLCDILTSVGERLNIWAYARIDTVKPRYLNSLKKAGVNWLALGIESGSAHVRDGAKKKLKSEGIVDIVRQIRDAGISVIGNFIYGLPDDTQETMQETYQLACDLNCEFINFYCAQAYPGSPLYDSAIDKGWKLPDSWIGYSQHSYECTPLPTNTLTGAQVLKFRDNAFHEYFNRSGYIGMIGQKFGAATAVHVMDMNEIKLKRKLLGD